MLLIYIYFLTENAFTRLNLVSSPTARVGEFREEGPPKDIMGGCHKSFGSWLVR